MRFGVGLGREYPSEDVEREPLAANRHAAMIVMSQL